MRTMAGALCGASEENLRTFETKGIEDQIPFRFGILKQASVPRSSTEGH